MVTISRNKAIGALVGLAVGDAVGMPVEFCKRDTFQPVTDLRAGGPFSLQTGQWTDDTSMALCLADSLIETDDFNATDLMNRFVNWYQWGHNSVTGECFDIGIATRQALDDYLKTRLAMSGDPDIRRSGNGSLMRLSPVAIRFANDVDKASDISRAQSRTTHASPLCLEACDVFARMLCAAIAGKTKAEVLSIRSGITRSEFARLDNPGRGRDDISSSGYVVDTLDAALWCVAQCDSFEDAVCLAVNLGDDSDTVGAVTGQIAGALWGYEAIPAHWRARLAWENDIRQRGEKLFDKALSDLQQS